MHPVFFKIGDIEFFSYGLMIGIGFLAGVWLASKRATQRGLDPDSFFWLFILLLAGGVVGGRLFHIVMNTAHYKDWRSVLDTRNGGFSVHGVLVGGAASLAAYARSKDIRFADLADLLAPSVALGQGFGRIGCFLAGCCYGIETSGTWGFCTRFAPGLRHPYQLYESAFDFALVAVLLAVSRKAKEPGTTFWVYIGGYAGGRFLLEFFRDNDAHVIGLSYGQWVSLAAFIAAVAVILYGSAVAKKRRISTG